MQDLSFLSPCVLLQRCDLRPVGNSQPFSLQLKNQGPGLDRWFLSFTALDTHCFLETGGFAKERGRGGKVEVM